MTDYRSHTLSTSQVRFLMYVTEYTQKHGYAPSYREIHEQLDIAFGAITYTINKLQRLGYVTHVKSKQRSIKVIRSY